jgi:FAD/FMN-containing dehydrogenase
MREEGRPERVAGWGRHPVRAARVARPERLAVPGAGHLLARGLGRAYGDAAVPAAAEDLVLETTRADRILDFDPETGLLTCEAGLSLAEILRVLLPRGWCLPVTPGTKFVTVGGAVASDVHGKNHHRDGSFGRSVERLVLATADGRLVACAPATEGELFRGTVGGMGLTGLIVEATFRMRRVESAWMVVETAAVPGLGAMVEGLRAASAEWPYTVGWIDCLARGGRLGRGVLISGRHASAEEAGGRPLPRRPPLRVPVDAPGWLLSPSLLRGFNAAYAWAQGRGRRRRLRSHDAFFYPLDAVLDWNRLYGARGFLQYQCVVPRAAGEEPIASLLDRLAREEAASFLAVVKDMGPEGDGLLSFPMEGLTLSLDLPYRGPPTEALVHTLNAIVREAGGRVYLAKDAVTRAEDFARMEPRLAAWRGVRERWDPGRRFRSALSARLLGDAP